LAWEAKAGKLFCSLCGLVSGADSDAPAVYSGVAKLPRPSKTIQRQKIAAGLEWKKGNREQAQKMWLEADKARKEAQAKKHNKKRAAEGEDQGESPAEPSE
jgi:uncharacterized Zn finger protein (UPF0148 family)